MVVAYCTMMTLGRARKTEQGVGMVFAILCRVEGTGPVVGGGGGSYCFCRASTTVSHGMHGIENVGVYS